MTLIYPNIAKRDYLKQIDALLSLRRCPFCGENVRMIKSGMYGRTEIICDQCGANVSFMRANDIQDVRSAWNRRVLP